VVFIVVYIFLSLLTVYTIIRRLLNAISRSVLRTAYELKHSPGFCYTCTEPLSFTGATTLDQNILLHGISTSLTTGDYPVLGSTLQMYCHPFLPLAGRYMQIIFPKEFMDPADPVSCVTRYLF
jgi:hypothetical protein